MTQTREPLKTLAIANSRSSKSFAALAAVLLCVAASGCASLTNPVAQGIPVRLLAPELLAEPKEGKDTIPLEWLGQRRPEYHQLAAGDVIGVYIEGVIGGSDELPPFTLPEGNRPPALGFPVPVRNDGTVLLPLVDPVLVAGMSVAEARMAIINAYTGGDTPVLDGQAAIIVELFQPRRVRVLVIRQDSPNDEFTFSSTGPLNRAGVGGLELTRGGGPGRGQAIELPAYENDVLNALVRTGGLPGLDAVNEVVVRRGGFQGTEVVTDWGDGTRVTRIPLRLPVGAPRPFSEEDIVLNDGDIIFVEARDSELFYTGGLLPPAEIQLPRDYDLDVVEAVIQVSGPLLNGGVNGNNLSGGITAAGIGNPSPSLLSVIRRTEDGRQVNIRVDLTRALKDPRENILVRENDILILQETPGEAFARYTKDALLLNFLFNFLQRQDATGTANLVIP